MSSVASRTVSTSGSTGSVAQFTSIVSAQSDSKPFLSFDRALSQHLQSGGTGNVFYDPVMHYDLNSMKEKFEAVNEETGIYKKDGVLYAKKDLGGSPVLQPIGIQKTKDGEYEAVGLSTDLPEEQAQALKKILTALKKTEGDLKKALEKVEEDDAAGTDNKTGDEGSALPAAAPDSGETHK